MDYPALPKHLDGLCEVVVCLSFDMQLQSITSPSRLLRIKVSDKASLPGAKNSKLSLRLANAGRHVRRVEFN
jgi:hypothetical protein